MKLYRTNLVSLPLQCYKLTIRSLLALLGYWKCLSYVLSSDSFWLTKPTWRPENF